MSVTGKIGCISRGVLRHLLLTGAGTLVWLLVVSGIAAAASSRADGTGWVQLSGSTALYEAPAESSIVRASIAAVDQEGLPVALRVIRRVDRNGVGWLKTRVGSIRGWMPAVGSVPAQVPPFSPRLRSSLGASMRRAGARAGAVFADSNGVSLFERKAGRPRILASNVKLFVTAAALDRLGSGIEALLGRILRPSDNWLAQRLFDRLGPSRRERIRRAEAFARLQGSRVQLVDGSGLARANQAAPAEVVAFLVGMRRVLTFTVWRDALPVTGRSGTLAGRMGGTLAEGHCQAKTGTLHDVSTLSGYCTARSGRRIVFSILLNDIAPWKGRRLQDRMLTALVRAG